MIIYDHKWSTFAYLMLISIFGHYLLKIMIQIIIELKGFPQFSNKICRFISHYSTMALPHIYDILAAMFFIYNCYILSKHAVHTMCKVYTSIWNITWSVTHELYVVDITTLTIQTMDKLWTKHCVSQCTHMCACGNQILSLDIQGGQSPFILGKYKQESWLHHVSCFHCPCVLLCFAETSTA